ncbi:MAG TPA: HAD family phosphatase [Sphingobacteriaceae bacterium]
MIKTIIFDLGGVLIDWNPEYLFRKIIHDEAERKHFFDHICTSDWNEEQDAGRPLEEATSMLVERFPEHEARIRAYYDRWEEMLGGAIEGTVEIFRQLKDRNHFRFYALTNWSAETFPYALQRFEFLQWFDGIVVSGEEKNRKPYLDFYQLMLDRYRLDPAEALFIDDNLRNVEAARQVGIRTIHYLSPEQLRESLARTGILPPED